MSECELQIHPMSPGSQLQKDPAMWNLFPSKITFKSLLPPYWTTDADISAQDPGQAWAPDASWFHQQGPQETMAGSRRKEQLCLQKHMSTRSQGYVHRPCSQTQAKPTTPFKCALAWQLSTGELCCCHPRWISFSLS